ncbi:DNA-binding response regulator [Photobacterium phosphoreum]|uniref:DNA-binding response regulator n=1 Tax=Photobacterium phosphoreum TaxID=659 RepID=A0A2T3PPI4_PHOPO|nr:response regulator transcription factor [Photobacterium phosphoreum]PSU24800.1 DNA-binding response regulator [Photobacterium phosphoreum]PSU36718.1 DNA-binding response regulator [Photobacterium phosphoreum]PSU51815.1 DNA-binding response regulator [Photobacterium phosphoreum]PSU73574.1 DNA-binding response regulator [Photobacterium phosphoreum]PSW34484.1 DNA-binding response regulator [Photobacterium phosphoreum]
MKLLIIEDSSPLRRSLVVGFNNLGITTDEASNGTDGLSLALNNPYDIIILDLMLPGIDGMEILKQLRQSAIQTRVIILSANSQHQDRIDGLLQGADDYLTKPFAFDELHARVIAISRRGIINNFTNTITINGFILDSNTMSLRYEANDIDLTPNEFKIIEYLFNHQNQVMSATMISDNIANNFDYISKNTIEAHISTIRKKIKSHAITATFPLKNKRGFGYYIES